MPSGTQRMAWFDINFLHCSSFSTNIFLKDNYSSQIYLSRTFVGTNLNPLWEKFLVPSEGTVMCHKYLY